MKLVIAGPSGQLPQRVKHTWHTPHRHCPFKMQRDWCGGTLLTSVSVSPEGVNAVQRSCISEHDVRFPDWKCSWTKISSAKSFFVVIKKDQHLAGYRLANYLEFRSGICGEISMQNPSVFDKGFWWKKGVAGGDDAVRENPGSRFSGLKFCHLG